MAIGKGLELRSTKLKASPSGCWCPQKMLFVKTPRYFNAFVWGGGTSPNRRVQSIIFQHGAMASDLEVLTLVTTSLHSAANRLGALTDRRSRQNRVICKKQRCHSDIRKPNILLTTAAPQDPVQACAWHIALYSVKTDTNYLYFLFFTVTVKNKKIADTFFWIPPPFSVLLCLWLVASAGLVG